MSQWLVTGWLSPENSYFNDLQRMKRIFAKDMPTIVNLKRKHQMTNHGLLNRYQVKNLSKKELELAISYWHFPPKMSCGFCCMIKNSSCEHVHTSHPCNIVRKKAASPSFTSQVKLIFACPLRPWNMGIHGPSGKSLPVFQWPITVYARKVYSLKIKWK